MARSRSQLGKYAPPSPTENATAEVSNEPTTAETLDDEFGFGVGLKLSKRDKRTVKHNILLHKVHEAGISKDAKIKKRRRPTKKLKTDMGGLEDALPDLDDDDDWEGIDEDMDVEGPTVKVKRKKSRNEGKMEMKSLKHKPGAMKKKFAMEGRERERFGKNLAGLMNGGAVGGVGGGQGGDNRWEALRKFIGGTMEKDKAFEGK